MIQVWLLLLDVLALDRLLLEILNRRLAVNLVALAGLGIFGFWRLSVVLGHSLLLFALLRLALRSDLLLRNCCLLRHLWQIVCLILLVRLLLGLGIDISIVSA